MHPAIRPALRTLSASVLCALSAAAPLASDAAQGRRLNVLNRNRAAYEQELQSLRRSIVARLRADLAELRRSGAGRDALAAAGALLEDFEGEGRLPEGAAGEAFADAYLQSVERMRRAFDTLEVGARREDAQAELDALARMREALESEWDLNPWGPELLTDQPRADPEAPLVAGLDLSVEPAHDRRFWIEARSGAVPGSLRVELLADDAVLKAWTAVADQRGDVALWLSLRAGRVSVDCGPSWSGEVRLPAGASSVRLRLSTAEGELGRITCRAKRIVPGAPPAERAPDAPRAQDDDAEAGGAPIAAFRTGLRWRGMWDGNGCEIEVVRGGESPALRISRSNGAVFLLEGHVRRDVFRLDVVHHTRVAQGGVARLFVSQSGTARIRNGRLFVDCETKNKIAGATKSFDIVIRDAEPY